MITQRIKPKTFENTMACEKNNIEVVRWRRHNIKEINVMHFNKLLISVCVNFISKYVTKIIFDHAL